MTQAAQILPQAQGSPVVPCLTFTLISRFAGLRTQLVIISVYVDTRWVLGRMTGHRQGQHTSGALSSINTWLWNPGFLGVLMNTALIPRD